MVQWHLRSAAKPSGGFRATVRARDKRLAAKGGNPALTKIGEEKKRVEEGRGATTKTKLLAGKTATVVSKKTKKIVKAEIVGVAENPANRQFTRQNIITKGAKIKVKIDGRETTAIVTSRPGQSGTVQAVLQE